MPPGAAKIFKQQSAVVQNETAQTKFIFSKCLPDLEGIKLGRSQKSE